MSPGSVSRAFGYEEMFDAYTRYVSERWLDERHADIEFFEVAGLPAVWIGVQEDDEEAEWTEEFATTTGLDLTYSGRRYGGALLLGVDGAAGPSAVRERFVETVADLPRGRRLAVDFKPAKVVYAILMPKGRPLTPDTLFPFSQATLAHAARILGTYGIDVEVVGIPAA